MCYSCLYNIVSRVDIHVRLGCLLARHRDIPDSEVDAFSSSSSSSTTFSSISSSLCSFSSSSTSPEAGALGDMVDWA